MAPKVPNATAALEQISLGHRVVAEPGPDGCRESVSDELRDDLMVGIRKVGVGGPGDKGQAVIGEVATQRLVHSVVGRIVPGVLVHGQEPLDMIGDVAGGEAQHLRG
jgi:hypothetical protein